MEHQCIIVQEISAACDQIGRRQIINDLRVLGIHIFNELGAFLHLPEKHCRQKISYEILFTGIEHTGYQSDSLKDHFGRLIANGLLQLFRILHCRHINCKIRTGTLCYKIYSGKINIITYKLPADQIHSGAHIIQLLCTVGPWSQPVLYRKYQISVPGEDSVKITGYLSVSLNQPAAVDRYYNRHLFILLDLRLKNIRGKRILLTIQVSLIQYLLHIVRKLRFCVFRLSFFHPGIAFSTIQVFHGLLKQTISNCFGNERASSLHAIPPCFYRRSLLQRYP